MSDKYNFYNNPRYYNYQDSRYTQSFQTQSYNPYFEQNFNPFNENQNTRKLSRPLNENITPIYSNNNNSRNTISVIPFPDDSQLDENIKDSSIIQPGLKIKKVSKINPRKQSYLSTNYQNKNITFNNQKVKKDVVSEKLLTFKKMPMDDLSGNSTDNRKIQSKSENDSEKSDNNNNSNKKTINKNGKDTNNNDINKDINRNVTKNQNRNNPNKNNINKKNQNNNNQNNLYINENLKNQFINRNLAMFALLKRIKFFQNLDQISQNRMQLFEKEFQNDIYFKKRDFFNNVFINNQEIGITIPLTLIFYYILNPKVTINQFSLKKNFYENVLLLHGYKNIKIIYDDNILKKVPKYFNDLNYVINLFQNFEISELNKFIKEINNWSKTFELEIKYEDKNNNNITDKIKIYFISPKDITVEYNSNSANSCKSFAEFNLHCDINYDKNRGRFVFKTSANVYDKCEELYQFEFLGEIWERALIVIKEESQKYKVNADKKFKEHLKKNLRKYSPNINYIIKDVIEKEKRDKSINESFQNIKNVNNVNINKNISHEIRREEKINNKDIETNFNKNIIKEKNNALNDKNKNKKEIIIINNKDKRKEQILFYGVILSFFIFIFKTVLSIELGSFSLDTFFNFLIIIIIGFMLVKNQNSA